MILKLKQNQLLLQLASIALIIFFSVILINFINISELKYNAALYVETDGVLGIVIYFVVNAVLYIMLIPSTVLGAASGVIFGFWHGIIFYSASCFSASLVTFLCVRFFLKDKTQQLVHRKSRLLEIQSLVQKEGLRFLFFIRFLPVHATFVNSLLSVSTVKPSKFLLSCVFLLPEWILHVYIGYVTTVTTQNFIEQGFGIEDYFRVISLIVSIVAILYLGWMAQKVFIQSNPDLKKGKKSIANSVKNIKSLK